MVVILMHPLELLWRNLEDWPCKAYLLHLNLAVSEWVVKNNIIVQQSASYDSTMYYRSQESDLTSYWGPWP